MPRRLPFGSWPSPISAELLVAGAALPSEVRAAGGVVWWLQSRPDEGGRRQVVRRGRDGPVSDALPEGFNARTRVHEYGGGAWWVHGGAVFACSWDDQRVYRSDPSVAGCAPSALPLTPEPSARHGFRYADGVVTPDGMTVICVREAHEGGDVRNEIVAFPSRPATGGAEQGFAPASAVLCTGRDFVAAPRVSCDGRRVAWLAWDHPSMPWDSTELWVADLVGSGAGCRIEGAYRIAGGPGESLVQPEWAPDGCLCVVSDRSDWWNVYRVDAIDALSPVHVVDSEVGRPAWWLGQSRYVVADDGTVWLTFSDAAGAHLVGVDTGGGRVHRMVAAVELSQLRVDGDALLAIVAESLRERWVGSFDLREIAADSLKSSVRSDTAVGVVNAAAGARVVYPPRDLGLDPSGLSRPSAVTFPTAGGRVAHAWFYPPTGTVDGELLSGSEGELPPLVTMIHGGPTFAADPSFSLGVQYWTSRGFAVVDVDYGGSTGYGRAYRRLLDGGWGIVDVDDACAAAAWLAGEGLVDRARLVITGGSAGGFTVLAALAMRDTFAAGASHYGVADLGAVARDTHKFESRYLDGLIGRWPADKAVYDERSPLNHIDGFDRPLIVLQGLEDEVVPPAQAQMIVDALRAKGVPHAYLTFAGEQHGFRQAPTIIRALTAELYFYSRVFGFEPAGHIEPVDIAFSDRL